MPALNIMATHEAFLNSGCSPSWPSRIFPKRETPRNMAKTRKPSVQSTKASRTCQSSS